MAESVPNIRMKYVLIKSPDYAVAIMPSKRLHRNDVTPGEKQGTEMNSCEVKLSTIPDFKIGIDDLMMTGII